MPQLDAETFKEIVDLLEPLTRTYDERHGLFSRVFVGIRFATINLEGDQYSVLSRIVNGLHDYGTIGDTPALWMLLEHLAENGWVGDDKKVRIKALEAKIKGTPPVGIPPSHKLQTEAPTSENTYLPNDEAIKFYNRGDEHRKAGRYLEAIMDYTRAIEIDKNYADVYNNRGGVYYMLKRYDDAIADCTQAIKIDNNNATAYNNRGIAYRGLERYDDAIVNCTQAIEIDKNYADAYFNRGIAYEYLEKYIDAVYNYTRAIEINPDYTKAYRNRADSYYQIGVDYYERAIADYQRYAEVVGKLEPFMNTRISEMWKALKSKG